MVGLVEATSCPACSCTGIRCKRKYVRSVRNLHGVETVEVAQHQCRQCRKTFTDAVKGIKRGAQIADEVN